MKLVPRAEVPPNANIVPSSAVYKWKIWDKLKAMIGPDGSRDKLKGQNPTDVPAMATDTLSFMVSFAVQHSTQLISLDIPQHIFSLMVSVVIFIFARRLRSMTQSTCGLFGSGTRNR